MSSFAERQGQPAEASFDFARSRTQESAATPQHPLLTLQRNYGNQAVQQWLSQSAYRDAAGVSVSTPGDIYEQEADRIAGQVMRSPKAGSQNRTGQELEASRPENSPASLPSHVQHALATGGRPLDGATRSWLEPQLGVDLDPIRLHEGPASVLSSQLMQAEAYTVGSDIVLGREAASGPGRGLLAHEVAHAVSAAPAAPAVMRQPTTTPMTRADFEKTLRERFAVVDIHTGTREEQANMKNVDPGLLTGWQQWDPGPASNDYATILRAFENFAATFGGTPNVKSVIFFQQDYEVNQGVAQPQPNRGASFGTNNLQIFQAFSLTSALPVSRSTASSAYASGPGMMAREQGTDPAGAPFVFPTREQTSNVTLSTNWATGWPSVSREEDLPILGLILPCCAVTPGRSAGLAPLCWV